MKIELFAKKMKKKEGGTFTKYLTKIIKKIPGKRYPARLNSVRKYQNQSQKNALVTLRLMKLLIQNASRENILIEPCGCLTTTFLMKYGLTIQWKRWQELTNKEFIEKIAPMVQEVFCDCRGVNPSVVIAQAILESGFGTSKLSKYNNIFGLNNYNDGYLVNAGYVLIEVPQEKNGILYYNYEKMATFDNLMDCIKSLKKWYTRPKYIENLNEAGIDSTRQIIAIKKSGYATDSKYVDKIVDIIKRFNLTQYDQLYTIQCGAYLVEFNASAEVRRLNKLFKTNKFYVGYYSDYFRVYYGNTFDKKNLSEWFNANRNILPKGSFIKEL